MTTLTTTLTMTTTTTTTTATTTTNVKKLGSNINFASTALRTVLLCLATQAANSTTANTEKHAQSLDVVKLLDDPANYFAGLTLVRRLDGLVSRGQYDGYGTGAIAAVGGQLDQHLRRYDSQADLRQSMPQAYRQATCACHSELKQLLANSAALLASLDSFKSSTKLSLMEQLDSFGSIEPRSMKGNNQWLGSFEQCVEAGADERFAGRGGGGGSYCVATYEEPQTLHNSTTSSSLISVELAACLPRECNSLTLTEACSPQPRPLNSTNTKTNLQLVDELIKLVSLVRQPYKSLALARIYCLPDEASPLRRLPDSGRLFVVLLACWLCFLAFANVWFEYFHCHRADNSSGPGNKMDKLSAALSVRTNFCKLFELGTEIAKISAPPPATAAKISAPKANLSAIDGIKVLTMFWIISAHCLLCYMRPPIGNMRDFYTMLKEFKFLSLMAGIFAVDTFFVITGLFTAYLALSKNLAFLIQTNDTDNNLPIANNKLATAGYWLEAILHRYLRLAPMYVAVFWFSRDVFPLLGCGPLWDYATAKTSLKARCRQESLLVPLTFSANFKRLENHCIKPAWYLANDMQFALLTPLLMLPLVVCLRSMAANSAKGNIGTAKLSVLASLSSVKTTIRSLIVLSLIVQFFTVFCLFGYDSNQTNAADFDYDTLINFKPLFATNVLKDLWQLYTLPWNRIGAYFVGLLTGIELFACCATLNVPNKPTNKSTNKPNTAIATGSLYFWPMAALVVVAYLPKLALIGAFQWRGLASKVGSSLVIPLTRLVWALSIGRVLYLSSSPAQVNDEKPPLVKALQCYCWRPLSKLGLSVLLIQWEIIGYLTGSQLQLTQMSFTFLASTIVYCTLTSYLLALIAYLLLEQPLNQLEANYLRPFLFGR